MRSYSGNHNKNKLRFQLMDVENKLFHLSSSTPHILNVLMHTEKVLSRVLRPPSKALVKVLHPIIKALTAKKLMRHPDVNVNISVVCCICEIIRMMASAPYNHKDMKEFFEVLVTSFEKQSSAAGGYRGKMTRVLEIFRKARLPAMMLDLRVEGLVERLFKQFLTSAYCNTSDTLVEMEKIMTTIIVESGELALDLKALIVTTLDKNVSPVCWQLGERVLLNCAAKLQPRLLDMEAKETIPSISETSNLRNDTLQEAKETIPSISETSNLRSDTTHKIKVECLEESMNTVQTRRNREHATTDEINHIGLHTEDGKKKLSSDDPPMPSKPATEVTGKRKRNNEQEAKETIPSISETSNLRKDTTQKIKVECPEESIDSVQTTDRVNLQDHHIKDGKKKVASNDPPMPSNSVIEVTGKRKRNNDQVLPFSSGNYSSMAVVCGSVLRVLPKSEYSWTFEDAKKKVPSNVPPMPSKSVTEVTGKRKRDNEQKGVARKVLYNMTYVQGYKVKKINAPILRAIFKKHGDIVSDCVVKTASVRESILEVVCEVVRRIQTSDVATIVSDMEKIEMQLLDAEATNMKVSWLRAHLEAIQKRNAAQTKSTLLVKTKATTSLFKRAAKKDLEERRIELLTARERFDKAEKCVKLLDLVEMKLIDNFVDCEAEKDLWAEQPLLQAN